MPANGPGDPPPVVVRRRRRVQRQERKKQQRNARAQERQYGSQGKAVEKTANKQRQAAARRPSPSNPMGDTKGDADRQRAENFQHSPKGRKAVRDTYAEQSHARRKQIEKTTRDRGDAVSAEVQRFHEERQRVEGYIKDAVDYAKRARENRDAIPPKGKADDIRKGLEVLKHQRQRGLTAATVPGVGELPRATEKAQAEAQREARKADNGPSISGAVGAVKALFGGKQGIQGSREIARVEKEMGPVDAVGRAAARPTLDAVTKALEQLNRVSSASAGAAIAAAEGENVAKGAVEGFKSNDKSYQQLVEKLGIHGPAAAIVGLAGDILLDPTTYASLGFKAPATAVERKLARDIAKKYAKPIKSAAKAGDRDAQLRLAEEYEKEMAAARRKASRHEGETRGVQVGVRLPGGRQVQTKGRVTAAVGKQVSKGTRKVQAGRATREINEVLRALSPHVRPQGVSKTEHLAQKDIERRAAALRNKVARDGRQLGKYIQRATGGDVEEVRRIIDAIESGKIDALPPKLREAARRADRFHRTVAGEFEQLTGKPLRLVETILPKADVDEALDVARAVLGTRLSKATRRAEDVDIEAGVVQKLGSSTDKVRAGSKTVDAEVDLAAAESLAERLASRERPLHISEERELVDRLQGIVDHLRQDAHTNIARTRTNDELGAIRRGEVDEADVKKALQAEDFYRKRAADQRRAGNRTAAKASEAKAREARTVIKAFREQAEPRHLAAAAEEPRVLKGRAGRLERLLEHLQDRVAHDPPEGYVPRQTQRAMEAEATGEPLRQGVGAGRTGHEAQRLERRRAADVREEKPDYLSEELPQLEARYGSRMGRRLGELSLWKQMVQRYARPATLENLAEEGGVIYRVDNSGAHRIDPRDRAANEQAAAEVELRLALGEAEDTGYWVLPEEQDRMLQGRKADNAERTATGNLYDRWLRGFKAMNTILRPGFFATTIFGNTWQMYLADASVADMKDAWRFLARLRHEALDATNPDAARRKAILDYAGGDKTFVLDGRAATFGDIFNEAIDAGVVRTGSRLGDPTELTLEQQAQRRLAKSAKASVTKTTEWLGELAEDLDDMTKLALYTRARTKLGLDSKAAAEFAFSKMIDYSDLSKAERKWFKRLMPFYVYTARNLPIQVKSLVARPGKLANYEKVRQTLAELSGLGEDWEGQRTEEEQERMPVPLPGVTSRGFQVFMDPRLPVSDVAVPAQVLEGPGGALRAGQRYASSITPPVKALIELLVNRRLDYDRPISTPGYRPPAGFLLRHIPGATEEHERVNARSGEKYTGAKPVIDYLLRSLGGAPGSALASLGAEVPDRSELPPVARVAASNIFGVGASASDPLEAVLAAVQEAADEHYGKRSELKARGMGTSDKEYVANEDRIQALRDLQTKIRGTIGYPEDRARREEIERRRLDVREPAGVRAERNRMNELRRRYGG